MSMLGDNPFEGWASGYDVDAPVQSEKEVSMFGPDWVEHQRRAINLSNEVEFLEAIWGLIVEVAGYTKHFEYVFEDVSIVKVKHDSRASAPDEIRFIGKSGRVSILTRLEVFHWGCVRAVYEGEEGKTLKLRTYINVPSALELITLKYYETL